MSLCHNPNHPDYKNLVKQVKDQGLITAILAYYGDKPLSSFLTKTTDLKKSLTFPYTTSRAGLLQLNKRVRDYNLKNGTSHSIDEGFINEDVYQPKLLVNYLPTNLTRQMLRDIARAEDGKVNQLSFDFEISEQLVKAFAQTNNEKIEIPNIPSTSRDLSFYKGDAQLREQEEGIDNIDYMLPTAGENLSKEEKKTRDYLNKKIISLKKQIYEATSPEQAVMLQQELNKLVIQYQKSEQRIIQKTKFKAFEDVLESADVELQEIAVLLSNPAITTTDAIYAGNVLEYWINAAEFTERHPFLEEHEMESEIVREMFEKRASVARRLNRELMKIKKNHLVAFVREHTDKGLTAEHIFRAIKDLSKIPGETLWLGRVEDDMLQAVSIAVEKANKIAEQEASETWKQLDALQKAALSSMKTLSTEKNPYSIFKQFTASGKETGRMVHLFSNEFFTRKQQLANLAFNQRDSVTGKLKKDEQAIKNYYGFLKNNTLSFDIRILFPDVAEGLPDGTAFENKYSEEDREKHIAELKRHIGEKQYDRFYESALKKVEKFKIKRQAEYLNVQNEVELSAIEKETLFHEWNREHSPYWALEMQDNPKAREKTPGSREYFSPKEGLTYLTTIPKRFSEDGTKTEWYDKNFEKIENNADLLAFYNYVTEMLITYKKVFPDVTQKLLGVNVLPTIEKSIMDNYSEKGLMMGYTPLIDSMVNSLTTSDLSKIHSEGPKTIQIRFIKDNKEEIVKRLNLKLQTYQRVTGNPATEDTVRELREEVLQELSQEKSWDLVKIMKAYSLMALSYKHKSAIEPQIKLAEQLFEERQEIITNKGGEEKTTSSGIATQKGLKNYNEAKDFYLDAEFYGLGSRKVEGPSKKKLLTKKERETRKQLLTLQELAVEDSEKQKYQQQIDELGSPTTTSGIVDSLLKYNLLTSLGWNIPSAMNNISFGVLANLTEAAGGIHFTTPEMRDAYMLTFNSIGRNASFNAWDGVNSNALKIRNLMDRGNHLKTSDKETYDLSVKSSLSPLKRFGPMSLQERSEYLNIAPVMIATMKHLKAKDADGKEVSYWDALDIEGNLKEGYTTDIEAVPLAMKIDKLVQMLHGDYAHKLGIKKTVLGRVVSQFRTWAFEGFANRFEAEKPDYQLSYGLSNTFMRKGRYRSYSKSKGQLITTGATIGTMILPGVGTAFGAGLGYISGRMFGTSTDQNALSDTLFTLKQLLRKAMFQKTQFHEKFDEVDAANMRKNMQELYMYVILYLAVLGLAGAAGADDDEEKMAALNTLLINQGNRLVTDIEFYTNPLALEKITKSAIPATRVIQKATDFFKAVGEQFDDDPTNDVLQSGTFKGENKAWNKSKDLILGLSTLKSGEKIISQVFEK
jgi:hypothetical protein